MRGTPTLSLSHKDQKRERKTFLVRSFAQPRKSSKTHRWPFELNFSVRFVSGDMKARLEKFLLKVRDDPEFLAVFFW
jgi:hypothetical protein